MFDGKSETRRDLGLPALVGLIGALTSLTVWGLLVADRRAQILEAAADTASEVHEAVEQGLEQQLAALHGLTALWGDYGLRPEPEWVANVGQRVEQVAGLSSVAWVDLEASRVRITPRSAHSAEDIEIDFDEVRRHHANVHLSSPEWDAAGTVSYRVFVPARTPENHSGMLVARFQVQVFLDSVLRARARGYALSVFWDAMPIFERGIPSEDPWNEWWRIEDVIPLPLGGSWRVVHRPTADFAAARLTPMPHYLLAAGILLSTVLAVVAHQFRIIVRQSRFLDASNRALERRGLELESKVADRTQALEEANAELEAFNFSVSHDLRSPLGAILNFAAILDEDYQGRVLDAEGVAILARIRRSALRATALLEDLLQLSRAGRAAMAFERVDMTALARESFAQVRAAKDDSDIELRLEPLPETYGDSPLLGVVFTNLFSNAIKYSRGCDKRYVAVSGRINNGECVYEVTDNGKGFDMRFVAKLFALFERLHADKDVEGTGVGLAMVSRIVKRHGGRVWAEGQLGEGARFSFALPRRQAQ